MRTANRLSEKVYRQAELDAAKLLGGGHYVKVTPAMRLRARVESTLRGRRLAAWLRALAERIDPNGGGA
jgi:hypothetical protein